MNRWVPTITLLGGSWVAISGVISPLIWVLTIATLLIAPLVTTHEPPGKALRTHILRLLGPKTILYRGFWGYFEP